MPLVHYCNTKEEAEAVKGASNIRKKTYDDKNLWLYDTHVGLCIKQREYNGNDDSDFYMIVWNEEKQAPEEIGFATTRAWTYPCFESKIDATDEIIELYNNYIEKEKNRLRKKNMVEQSVLPLKGKKVAIVAGRKYPYGTQGVVFWIGKDKWGSRNIENVMADYNLNSYRLGLKNDIGETLWVRADQVEVLNPEQYR